MVGDELAMQRKLDVLRDRHRELDRAIEELGTRQHAMQDEFTVRRLKKEKLALRDQILRLEEVVYPDIIA